MNCFKNNNLRHLCIHKPIIPPHSVNRVYSSHPSLQVNIVHHQRLGLPTVYLLWVSSPPIYSLLFWKLYDPPPLLLYLPQTPQPKRYDNLKHENIYLNLSYTFDKYDNRYLMPTFWYGYWSSFSIFTNYIAWITII